MAPVVAEGLDLGQGRALGPVGDGFAFGPAGMTQAVVEVVELVLGDVQDEGLDGVAHDGGVLLEGGREGFTGRRG